MMHAGEPGGHQARQQEEDRADAASFDGAQTCKFLDKTKFLFLFFCFAELIWPQIISVYFVF